MGVKRIRLRTVFIQYLLSLGACTLLLAFLCLGVFTLLMQYGMIVPANHTEQSIAKSWDVLQRAPQITEEMIPWGAEYAVLDQQKNYISGNIPKERALDILQKNQSSCNLMGTNCSDVIEREHEVIVLQYAIVPQFTSNFLHNTLPNPQLTLLLFFVVLMLLEVILISGFFARRLSQKMASLQEAAHHIEAKNLDFTVVYSGVSEIDEVLSSLEQLREELKKSLEQQWNLEQMKKEQISALAHDIKTPLTIIQGNADLLIDSDLAENQQEYIGYISKNADQIEQYMATLIEISNTRKQISPRSKWVATDAFIQQIRMQLDALVVPKRLQIEFHQDNNLPPEVLIDDELLHRAMMNVLANAVEYSPYESVIYLQVEAKQDRWSITVTDSGSGFTSEGLQSAVKQFYRGDSSRTSKSHYGLGLYIADTIVRQHQGSLHISNSTLTGGGQVRIDVPVRGVR